MGHQASPVWRQLPNPPIGALTALPLSGQLLPPLRSQPRRHSIYHFQHPERGGELEAGRQLIY